MTKFLFALIFAVLVAQQSFSQSPCDPHPLFTKMPNHSISGCEEYEYDKINIRYQDEDWNWIQYEKAGYLLKTYYTFNGEMGKNPSNAMIFQNYIQAISSKGGTIIDQANANLYLHFKSAGDSWYIHIQSDQSGSYSVYSLREENMNQYIALSAEDIAKEMQSNGKATFYGIYFDTDKSEIKPESKETLEQMANYLKSNTQVNVFIVGHTDNTGSFEHNQQLSEKRAEAVVTYLIENHQIAASRLKGYGVSSLSPVSTNTSEEGKSKNRRVEMVLR